MKNKVRIETSWALLAKFITTLGGLFFIIFIPKLVGIEIYGQFSLIQAYIAIGLIFFGNSLSASIKKEVSENKYQLKSFQFYSEAVKLKLYTFIIATVLFFVIKIFFQNILLDKYSLYFLGIIAFTTFYRINNVFFESVHKLRYTFTIYVIEYSVKIGCILYFYFQNNLTLEKILLAFIVGYCFAFLYGYITLHRILGRIPELNFFSLSPSISKLILKRGFYLSLTHVSLIILSKIDTLMISYFLTIKDVGIYNIADNLIKNATIISAPFILGIAPLFAQKNIKTLFFHNIKKLILINLILFAICFVGAQWGINFIYGTEAKYQVVITLLKIFSLFPLISSIQLFLQQIFILKDKIRYIFFSGSLVVVINIILNYFLIQEWGLYGAAISTIIAYVFWVTINYIYILKSGMINNKSII